MNLLEIVREASSRIGISQPSSVIGASDVKTRKLLALANQDGKSLARRHDWQDLVIETTFTATATETQTGALPTDYDRLVSGTFYNRTQARKVVGPLTPQRWQLLKSSLVASTWDSFRIRGNDLIMNPVPTAGDTLAFEYVTKYWCGGAAATTPTQSVWTSDDDIAFLDDELLVLGLVWRYQKAEGLDYGESMQDYELRLAGLAGTDGGNDNIDLASEPGTGTMDPWVPDGNWTL